MRTSRTKNQIGMTWQLNSINPFTLISFNWIKQMGTRKKMNGNLRSLKWKILITFHKISLLMTHKSINGINSSDNMTWRRIRKTSLSKQNKSTIMSRENKRKIMKPKKLMSFNLQERLKLFMKGFSSSQPNSNKLKKLMNLRTQFPSNYRRKRGNKINKTAI